MAPLTVISLQPEAVEFRVARDGAMTAWVRLQNMWSGQVAYKMKTTSPKDYTIKPASGSIRQGEFHDVQIVRKSVEEGGSPDSSKKVKFLIQAAAVTTQAQKLLLYAADKGKAAGRTKFWDSIPKEELQEQQLPVRMPSEENEEFEDALEVPHDSKEQSADATRSELWKARKARSQEFKADGTEQGGDHDPDAGGPGAGRGAEPAFEAPHNRGRKGDGRGDNVEAGNEKPATRKAGYGGKLTTQDVDNIIGRMTKIGPDGKPVVQVVASRPAGSAPPGFDGAEPLADAPPHLSQSPEAPPAERKPLNLTTTAHKVQKHDVVLQGHSRPVTSISFDATGKILYTCGKDKLVIAWSVPEGECLRQYEGHRGAVWDCSLNNDEGLLLSCGADNFVLLWEAASAKILYEVELPGVVRCVEWSHGLCLRFACCCNGFKAKPAAVSVFEISTLGAISSRCCTSIEVPTLPSAATQVAWAGPYWEWLCSLHDAGLVIFWNALTGSQLTRLTAHEEMVSRIAFPGDGRLMVSCGRQDMEVRLWCLARESDEESDFEDMAGDSPAPELMRNFVCDRPLNTVAVRPSLTFKDAASEDADGGACTLLAGGGQDARDVALIGAGTDVDQFEPLPLRFAKVSDSGAPGLEYCPAEGAWDPRLRKGGHFGPIHALAFSPDARICASGSEDGNVRLRELF
mmetsp:Transcript_24508/g.56900  ORF Transcript_24508/g.56900 Transcript_24508/m.56900 type:complete len:685 (-) Transcript_24508:18-2072(-)